MMVRTTIIRNNRKIREKSLWIGLIEVAPWPGNECFGNAEGAYVNVVTLATSALSFKRRVKRAVDELNMTIIEFDPPEQLRSRLSKKKVDKEIIQMAETARKLDSVVFGTFHTFSSVGES